MSLLKFRKFEAVKSIIPNNFQLSKIPENYR